MTSGVKITEYGRRLAESLASEINSVELLASEIEALEVVEDASRDLLKHLDCSLLRDTALICSLRNALRRLDEVRSGI